MSTIEEQVARLEAAIAAVEAQRTILGDEIVETALIPLCQQLAELCGASGRLSLPALAGERKLVTVMFADVSGVTAVAETLDPEAVRDLMNGCLTVRGEYRLSRSVRRSGNPTSWRNWSST